MSLNIPIPFFCGNEDEDALRWLRSIQNHFLAAGLDDARRQLGHALCSLRGLAESWAASQDFQDYSDFAEKLLDEYPADPSVLLARIEGHSQGDKSVQQYSQDALALHAMLREGAMSESLLVRYYVDGLQPELRAHVNSCCPDSVGRAIQAAKYAEHQKNLRIASERNATRFMRNAQHNNNVHGNNAGGRPTDDHWRRGPDNTQWGQDNRPPDNRPQHPWGRNQRGPRQDNNRPPAPANAPTRPPAPAPNPPPPNREAPVASREVEALTEQFRQMMVQAHSTANVNVFELQPGMTGEASSSNTCVDIEAMANSVANMALDPARYGFHSGEQQQLLHDVNGIMQARMQSLVAEKRPRPTGPPYQPHRHKPRFEGFNPDDVEQEMRDASGAPEPGQGQPRQNAAAARRTVSRAAPKLTAVEQLGLAKVTLSQDDMWAAFPAYADESIAHILSVKNKTAHAPAMQEAHLHAEPVVSKQPPSAAYATPQGAGSKPVVSVVRVAAHVNGLLVPNAIVDTGSTHTVMSHVLLRRMGKHALEYLSEPSGSFLTSSGERAMPMGIAASCLVAVGELELPVDIQVTRASNYELLIGMDWLTMAGADISIGKSCLTISIDKGLRIEVPIRVESTTQPQHYVFNATQLPDALQGLFLKDLDTVGERGVQDMPSSASSSSDSTQSDDDSLPSLIYSDQESDDAELPEQLPPYGSDDEDQPTPSHHGSVSLQSDPSEDEEPETAFGHEPYWSVDISAEQPSLPSGGTYPFLGFNVHAQVTEADDLIMQDIEPWTKSDSDASSFQLDHLHADQREVMQELLEHSRDVFAFDPLDLGHCTAVEHFINTGDAAPVRVPVRRFSQYEKSEIIDHVHSMLDGDIIEDSKSAYRSNPLIVPKKGGGSRFCVSFRKVNDITVHDSYAIPQIIDIIDDLGDAKFFSLLDMRSGYWQVSVAVQDREKTAFWTPMGLFQFKKMPFGLSTAPATFQRLMDTVLRGLPFARAFMDDCCVYSITFEDHMSHLQVIFDRLRHYDLKLHPGKCSFLPQQLLALGHIITPEGVLPNPAKVAALVDMPAPTDRTGVRSLLGMASYYRRFIEGFAAIAYPLTMLTRQDVPFHWGEAQQEAFETLKRCLTSPPVLVRPSFSAPFTLATDWQPSAVGAVLSQQVDGTERVIAYASVTLTASQRNWGATDGECYAVVWAVKHFRAYLHGVHFILLTDHSALQYLMTSPHISGRLLRWSVVLQEFSFTVRYRPGRLHGNADALSRLPLPPAASTLQHSYADDTVAMVMMTAGTAGPSAVGGESAEQTPKEQAPMASENLSAPAVKDTPILDAPSSSETLPYLPGCNSPKGSNLSSSPDVFADTACCICEEGEDERGDNMLLCDGCNRGYHLECLHLKTVPKGEWLCPACYDICARQNAPFPTDAHTPAAQITVTRGGLDALTAKPASASACASPSDIAAETSGLPPDPTDTHDIYSDSSTHAYLMTGRMPENLPPAERKRVKKRAQGYIVQDGLLKKVSPDGKLREVPAPGDRKGLIKQFHDDMGHYATRRVYGLLCDRFFWSSMESQVDSYISNCIKCREDNIKFTYEPDELHPIAVKGIINRLHLDIKGPLPETPEHNKYIIVAMDSLSKWPEAMALKNKSAASTAYFMLDVLSRHGCPSIVVTDNGTEFQGEFARTLKQYSIQHMHTSAYHPQANGLVERMNRTLSHSLSRLVDMHTMNWDLYLPTALMGYRASRHETTRLTPFYLLYGREPVLPVDLARGPQKEPEQEEDFTQLTTERIDTLQKGIQTAMGNIQRSQARAVATHSKKRKLSMSSNTSAPSGALDIASVPFQPGAFVYQQQPASAKFSGPPPIYKVHKLNSKGTTVTLTDANGAHFNSHTSRLSLYKPASK